MKVVFGGQIARPAVLRTLRAMSGFELTEVDEVEQVAPYVAGADVLVIANPRGKQGVGVAAALRDPSCTVKWVQVVSAGTDGLLSHDIPRSIRVTNQGGAAAPAVAEHAMALMLALCRRIDLISADTAQQVWGAQVKKQVRGLEGSTIGIVGFGNIGREIAARARAFGVDIVGFSRSGEPHELADRMHRLAELGDRVGDLDVLVSSIALVPETYHLIGADILACCKASCFLINVSRGEIVDPTALEAALTENRLAGAALDVTEPEPLPASSPLWKAPNLIVSPHIAASGNKRVGERIALVVKDNLQRFQQGQPLLNEVAF